MPKRMMFVVMMGLVGIMGMGQVVAQETYQIYHGDLHAHSGFSHDSNSVDPDQAFQNAKNSGRGDFFAMTDHDNITQEQYDQTQIWADQYTDENFVCIGSYEGGSPNGHINVFGNAYIGKKVSVTPDVYYDWLIETDSIGQWNHPAPGKHSWDDYKHYTPERDKQVCLIEQEGSTEFPMFFLALDKGWHISPTCNSDTHSNSYLSGSKRTGVLATALTREALYDAFKNRRTFATFDRNLEVRFSVNGLVMGSIAPYAETYNLTAQVSDPDTHDSYDKITRLEIVSQGQVVVASKDFSSHSVEWSVSFAPQPNRRYYFLRVYYSSGLKALSAPVWTPYDLTPPAQTVTGLSAAAYDDTRIDLTWDAGSDPESGINSYRIYRDGEWLVTVESTSYSDTWLQSGTTYVYTVAPVNGEFLEGPQCEPLIATPLDTEPWPAGSGSGTIVWEFFEGMNDIAQLLTTTAAPDAVEARTLLETPYDVLHNDGARMVGYLTPPVTGDYTFWIAASVHGELWLSTDETPDNVRKIAQSKKNYPEPREWRKDPEQQSDPITLQAGQRYYIMVPHKAGGGIDHCAVAWKTGNHPLAVIDGQYLTPLDGVNTAPVIDSAPWADTDPVTLPNTTNVNVVASDADGDTLSYTWSKVSGPGAVTFTPNGTAASNVSEVSFSLGGTYTLRVTVSDGTTSVTGDLTIVVNPATALDHFDFSTIGTPQTVGVPFSVTITAMLTDGNPDTSYSGTITLSGLAADGTTPVAVTPTSVTLVNGTATVDVTVNEAATDMTLEASD